MAKLGNALKAAGIDADKVREAEKAARKQQKVIEKINLKAIAQGFAENLNKELGKRIIPNVTVVTAADAAKHGFQRLGVAVNTTDLDSLFRLRDQLITEASTRIRESIGTKGFITFCPEIIVPTAPGTRIERVTVKNVHVLATFARDFDSDSYRLAFDMIALVN